MREVCLYEEVNIRPYIELLVRRWWIILGIVVVLAVLAFVGTRLLLQDSFQARAAVAIVRARTDVTFDPRIETLFDEELASVDRNARRDALIALVKSPDVATGVLEEIGDQLPPEQRSVGNISDMVEADNQGDLIQIAVTAEDRETAALVANTWAKNYVRHVNAIYGTAPGEAAQVTSSQVESARSNYEEAQRQLEAFLESSQVTALQNEIAAQQSLLNNYLAARTGIESRPVQTLDQVLADYYANLQQIEQWLADANALRQQVSADSDSPVANLGNTLALVTLRAQAYGGAAGTSTGSDGTTLPAFAAPSPFVLQLDSGAIDRVRPADVDSVIEVLEARRANTLEQIATIAGDPAATDLQATSLAPDHPVSDRVNELEVQLQELTAALEQQQAVERELVGERDLTWDTYNSLRSKQVEQEITAQTSGAEVRVASQATVPESADGGAALRNTIIVAGVALVLSIFGVLALGWWQQDTAPAREEPTGSGS
jgi:uncharacterized protein involved in exopolysaccharide biosynthesis